MSHRDMLCLCSILMKIGVDSTFFFFEDWRNCQVSRRCWCVVSTVNFCFYGGLQSALCAGGGQGGTTIHGPVSRDCVLLKDTGRKPQQEQFIFDWIEQSCMLWRSLQGSFCFGPSDSMEIVVNSFCRQEIKKNDDCNCISTASWDQLFVCLFGLFPFNLKWMRWSRVCRSVGHQAPSNTSSRITGCWTHWILLWTMARRAWNSGATKVGRCWGPRGPEAPRGLEVVVKCMYLHGILKCRKNAWF